MTTDLKQINIDTRISKHAKMTIFYTHHTTFDSKFIMSRDKMCNSEGMNFMFCGLLKCKLY